MPNLVEVVFQPKTDVCNWFKSQNLIEGRELRGNLVAIPQLIAVDGIDGAGKDTLSNLMAELLSERLGENKVTVLNVTNFGQDEARKSLRKDMATLKGKDKLDADRLDQFYATAVSRAYLKLVFESLRKDQVVILNRSELDLLRFALENRDDEYAQRRQQHIEQGILTWGLWPGYRVFIDISPEEAWKNLQGREYKSPFDPQNLSQVEKRIGFQKEAEERILRMPHTGEVKVIKATNHHFENERDQHLMKIAQSIVDQIVF